MADGNPTRSRVDNPLNPEQQALLEEVQRLFAEGHEEVSDELIARLDLAFKWSYDDEASIDQTLYFTAHDPFLHREMAEMSRDFATAELADAQRKLNELSKLQSG